MGIINKAILTVAVANATKLQADDQIRVQFTGHVSVTSDPPKADGVLEMRVKGTSPTWWSVKRSTPNGTQFGTNAIAQVAADTFAIGVRF